MVSDTGSQIFQAENRNSNPPLLSDLNTYGQIAVTCHQYRVTNRVVRCKLDQIGDYE